MEKVAPESSKSSPRNFPKNWIWSPREKKKKMSLDWNQDYLTCTRDLRIRINCAQMIPLEKLLVPLTDLEHTLILDSITVMCRWVIIELQERMMLLTNLPVEFKNDTMDILTACRLVDKECIDAYNSIFTNVWVSTLLHWPFNDYTIDTKGCKTYPTLLLDFEHLEPGGDLWGDVPREVPQYPPVQHHLVAGGDRTW